MFEYGTQYVHAPRVKGNSGDWMNLGAGVGLIAPAGIVGTFNSPGSTFFVDIFAGDNANAGTDPTIPFQTLAYALTQCTNDRDDRIIIMDAWNEATPIAINISRVHILGLSANPERPYPVWTATGDTNIFTLSDACNSCEIAYMDFGGGATSAGIGMGVSTPMGVVIHHCTFGNGWAGGDTPAYGILCPVAGNATGLAIVACQFRGTGGNAGGVITIDGIHMTMGVNLGGRITNCILMGCPGVAINMAVNGDSFVIAENIIACDADTQGSAITLSATTLGCLVTGNKAMFGDAAGGMVQNPYLDLAAAGSNHWAANMKGAAFIDPA